MQNILIDTNILMLLIIGSLDREAIPRFRRTQTFIANDFDLVRATMAQYANALTTAGVLTEVSNLMGNVFHEAIAPKIIDVCAPFVEVRKAKEDVFTADGFPRLGFSDASILSVLDDQTVLLTDDLQLYLQAGIQGFDVINFNHLRKFN